MKLTDVTIRALPAPATGSKIYADDSLVGFGVRVTAKTVRSFVLTYGVNRERVTIGRYPIIGLADARIEAKRILAERTLGKFRPKRITFADALELFLETRRQRNRPKTARETEKLLKSYFTKLHAMSLEEIRAHHVADITDALSKKGLQSTASHAHTAVKTFLKFCAQRHYITSSPISEMEKPTLPKSRERILTDEELRAMWKAAETIGGNFGKITQLLILTGQRRSEIGSLQTSWLSSSSDLSKLASSLASPAPISKEVYVTDCEVRGEDVDIPQRRLGGTAVMPTQEPSTNVFPSQCTITIPSEYTKNKRSHTFPIGALTAALLTSSKPQTGLFFSARGSDTTAFSGWSKAKAQLDKKITEIHGKPISFVLHDARRTYVTNLQRLKIPLEVREALVNHISGASKTGVAGVYNRYQYWDEMVEAVTTYENWFTNQILSD